MKIIQIAIVTALSLVSCRQEVKINVETKTADSISLSTNEEPANEHQLCEKKTANLGIGLILSGETENDKKPFEIFNDSLLTKKFGSYKLYSENDNICSFFWKPDYSIMHFICLEETKKSYKILINYDEVKYLPKGKKYAFKSWENYLLQSYGLSNLPDTELVVKKEPNEHAKTIATKLDKTSSFCAYEVKGDWVKIGFSCSEELTCNKQSKSCKEKISGWIRWRKGNELLVQIALLI